MVPESKTCEGCWATYEGWRSDSGLCPDCAFEDEDRDEDAHRCQQCGRPIHVGKTLCSDCEYPVVEEAT